VVQINNFLDPMRNIIVHCDFYCHPSKVRYEIDVFVFFHPLETGALHKYLPFILSHTIAFPCLIQYKIVCRFTELPIIYKLWVGYYISVKDQYSYRSVYFTHIRDTLLGRNFWDSTHNGALDQCFGKRGSQYLDNYPREKIFGPI